MIHDLSIIILAAGKGTRMKSDLPKVMHKVAAREMLNMVIDEAKKLKPKNICVVISAEFKSFEQKIIDEHHDCKIIFALQHERKGTAHAVQTGLSELPKLGEKVLVLYGDTPLIEEKTLREMLAKLEKDNALCVLGFNCMTENAYGRLVTDAHDNLEKIVEYKDANAAERGISLCNSGVVAVQGVLIERLIAKVKNENAAGEFYLTDIVGIARQQGLRCSFIRTYEEEVLGVNSRFELATIENIKQNLLRKKHMDSGVTMVDPMTVYFAYDTKIAHDCVIHPQVVFGKNVVIEKNVEVKSFSHIEGAKINAGAVVGPFARIRPGTKIDENVRIGNFVEVKNSHIKSGTKINHLSYVGDSQIGHEANIGAGVITCNYDGYNKFKTEIGDKVFIGSNSALVAPVKIGAGAVVGAGSVITHDVQSDDLAVARARQTNLENGGKKYHHMKSKEEK